MDEAEKMAALKRAYAEIILNTAKESAARILVSERRAVQSQQSLAAAKEGALATLLRLKAIMDSKEETDVVVNTSAFLIKLATEDLEFRPQIKEAEKASLGQVRRIQELEVQLTEAKDTINCLRTELKRVNCELEKMKNNLMEPLSESDHDHATSYKDKSEDSKCNSDLTPSCPAGPGHESNSITEQTTVCQRTASGNCCFIENSTEAETLKELSPENECASNPDLASIIMRSKEPELYRNGCTQRIRALEQKLLTGRLSLVKTNDKCSNFKNELAACGNRKVENPCAISSAGANKIEVQKETPPESKVMAQHPNNSENGQIKFFRRFSLRRSMAKCKNMTTINSGTDQDMAGNDLSQNHCSKDSGQDNKTESGDNLFRAVDDEPQGTLNSRFAPLSTGSCISPAGRKMRTGMPLRNEVSGFLQSNKRTITSRTVKRKIHPKSDSQISGSPASRTGEVEHEKSLIDSTEEKDILLTRGAQNDTGDALQAEDSVFVTPDQDVVDKLDISACEVKPETDDASLTKSDPKDENICEPSETSIQGESDRFLKYTFRRKRKRGSSGIQDEVALPENSNSSKRRTVDKQNALPEPQKPSIIRESSRDSRRMAQVARQLISLSEKRWW